MEQQIQKDFAEHARLIAEKKHHENEFQISRNRAIGGGVAAGGAAWYLGIDNPIVELGCKISKASLDDSAIHTASITQIDAALCKLIDRARKNFHAYGDAGIVRQSQIFDENKATRRKIQVEHSAEERQQMKSDIDVLIAESETLGKLLTLLH